mmetsp:Transcript_771/g.1711  ORF Transcript_771/g.1711 Transcript_771/m.1711 type:complete len:202 (-) Transcript_771:1438-2043(-)
MIPRHSSACVRMFPGITTSTRPGFSPLFPVRLLYSMSIFPKLWSACSGRSAPPTALGPLRTASCSPSPNMPSWRHHLAMLPTALPARYCSTLRSRANLPQMKSAMPRSSVPGYMNWLFWKYPDQSADACGDLAFGSQISCFVGIFFWFPLESVLYSYFSTGRTSRPRGSRRISPNIICGMGSTRASHCMRPPSRLTPNALA